MFTFFAVVIAAAVVAIAVVAGARSAAVADKGSSFIGKRTGIPKK